MSNFQGGPANPTGPSGPADPLGALVSALRDSWILGIAAAEKMLSHGVGAPPSDPGASPSDVGKQVEMISLVAQSYLIAATSGMRYLSRVAQTYSSHQSNILSSFLGTGASKQLSEEDRRAVAENIRAYLREVGELAEQEARLLQVELEKVGEGLARATSEGDNPPTYQRQWKAKP